MFDATHEVLGQLVLQKDQRSFEGAVKVGLQTVPLYIDCETGSDLEGCLESAARLHDRIPAYVSAAKIHAAEELLTLKNESWLEGSEKPLTKEDFIDRIVLESVILNSDGTATIPFLDGDIFFGHWIVVRFDAQGRPRDVELAG